jgi:tetratricopeptide (TPR) repeat protein
MMSRALKIVLITIAVLVSLWLTHGGIVRHRLKGEHPDAKMLRQAYSLYHLDRYDEAIASFDRVLRRNPTLEPALVGKGRILYAQGKFSEAIEMYDRALKTDPKSSVNWYTKAEILHRMGKNVEALASIDEGITHIPGKT